MSKELFDEVSLRSSIITTNSYSTSFSFGIRCLDKELQAPLYSLYGFVRFADEIVDSFHEYDKKTLLERFRQETYRAVEEKISLNPILNSFQFIVNKYKIEQELYEQFLRSMEMDLAISSYNKQEIKEYILGSAEVVGLMSLRIFCNGDNDHYQMLKPYAMKLGSAFQKINFLRDLNADFNGMGRAYFPGFDLMHFDDDAKKKIEVEIADEFRLGYEGVRKLPKKARLGVYVSYLYYKALFEKIKNTSSEVVLKNRIRIRNYRKLSILAYCYLRHQLNLI